MTVAYREKSEAGEPHKPDPPEIVLLDTIRKLDELSDDEISKVLRALHAYYFDEDEDEDPT